MADRPIDRRTESCQPLFHPKNPVMKSKRNPFLHLLATGAGLVLLTVSATAANFYWDADPATASNQNGDGIWNTANTNWTSTAGGSPNVTWANASDNTAFIGNASGTGYTNPGTGGTITLGEDITLFSLSMSSGQAGSYIVEGGGFSLNFAGAEASVANNNTSATLTINAPVTGSAGLKKVNNGRVILAGTNSYTGRTNITAGILQFANRASLYGGDDTQWTESNISVTQNSTLRLSVGGAGQFTNADVAVLASLGSDTEGFLHGSILGLDTANAADGVFTCSTDLADTDGGWNFLGLSKYGANTLALTGTNTHSGTTRIFEGTLRVGTDAEGLSPYSNLILSNGVIEANGIFNRPIGVNAGEIQWTAQTGNGGFAAVGGPLEVTLGSGATLNWSATAGTSKFGSNSLVFGSSAANARVTLVNNISLNFTRTIRVDSGAGGDAAVLAGVLSHADGGIIKTGAGLLILAADNTYGSTTTVNNGTLQVGDGGSTGTLGAGAITVNSPGILGFQREGTLTVNNTIGGSGQIRQTGTGTTILGGANTYGGSTTITAGTLEAAHATALGNTAGATTIQSAGGGRLALSGNIALAENITINARNSGAHLQNTSGENSLTGTLTWNAGGTGYGVVSLAGKLTITGPVAPAGGSKTLAVSGDGDVEFTGAISDPANAGTTLAISKTGAGVLTFSGANTCSGTTIVTEGRLVLTNAGSLSDTADLFIGDGAVVELPTGVTEVVGALFIDGVDMGDGTFHSGNTGGAIQGGSIQVGEGTSSPFETWISTTYPELTGEEAKEGADPDDDGIPNLLEFALMGDPTDSSDAGLTAALVQDASAPAGNELTLVIATRTGAAFAGGATASVDGITYTVEGSLDLSFPGSAVSSTGPSATAPAATGLPDLTGSGWEYHTFKLDASEGLGGKGFLRVKVTQP